MLPVHPANLPLARPSRVCLPHQQPTLAAKTGRSPSVVPSVASDAFCRPHPLHICFVAGRTTSPSMPTLSPFRFHVSPARRKWPRLASAEAAWLGQFGRQPHCDVVPALPQPLKRAERRCLISLGGESGAPCMICGRCILESMLVRTENQKPVINSLVVL